MRPTFVIFAALLLALPATAEAQQIDTIPVPVAWPVAPGGIAYQVVIGGELVDGQVVSGEVWSNHQRLDVAQREATRYMIEECAGLCPPLWIVAAPLRIDVRWVPLRYETPDPTEDPEPPEDPEPEPDPDPLVEEPDPEPDPDPEPEPEAWTLERTEVLWPDSIEVTALGEWDGDLTIVGWSPDGRAWVPLAVTATEERGWVEVEIVPTSDQPVLVIDHGAEFHPDPDARFLLGEETDILSGDWWLRIDAWPEEGDYFAYPDTPPAEPDSEPEPPTTFAADSLTLRPAALEASDTTRVTEIAWMTDQPHACVSVATEPGYASVRVQHVSGHLYWVVVPRDPDWWPGACSEAEAALPGIPTEDWAAYTIGPRHPYEAPAEIPSSPRLIVEDGTLTAAWDPPAGESWIRYRLTYGGSGWNGNGWTTGTSYTLPVQTEAGWFCVQVQRDGVTSSNRCNSWGST